MGWAFVGTARARGWRVFFALIFALGCLFPTFSVASEALSEVVNRFVAKHPKARVGVLAFDLDGNRLLVAHNPKDLFVPASVAKVFVTSALLSTLGADYRFVTRVVTNGSLEIERGILHGDLILKGSGYPGLDDKDIRALAGVLVRSRGIREVEGEVGVDTSLFVPPERHFYADADVFGDDWAHTSGAMAYMGVVSPLSLQCNNIEVRVRGASKVGRPALVEVDPELPVTNRARTVSGKRARVYASLTDQGTVSVSGSIGPRRTRVLYKPVKFPEQLAGLVFKRALEKAGASIRKGTIQVHEDPIQGATEIASVSSGPLPEVLYPMNAYSNNTMAEGFLLVYGAMSTRPGADHTSGIQALSRFLEQTVRIPKTQAELFDAAGLSKNNRVSPLAMIKLLHYMHASPNRFEALKSSLAVPGRPGTLSRRFAGNPLRQTIRAKTGTLDGVSALAGYLVSAKGNTVAFCVFVNQMGETYEAKRFEDELINALAKSG
jgi:D-alanyl-D-alanine carboxypeptidase/D-alanyl-D-alanine-endopeptidase (penicillin-binding protein 4)